MSIAQMLLPEFDQEMASTRKLLQLVPDDKLDYKPHEKSMTLGRLASHVAEMPNWILTTITTDSLDLAPGMTGYMASSRQEMLQRFDAQLAEARAALAGASDEDMGKMWTLSFGGNPIFTMPRASVVRISGMNHLIHHRAQLGVYLRLNEIAIPGMYGPSADEMKFWQASQS